MTEKSDSWAYNNINTDTYLNKLVPIHNICIHKSVFKFISSWIKKDYENVEIVNLESYFMKRSVPYNDDVLCLFKNDFFDIQWHNTLIAVLHGDTHVSED